jgi:hypothetical protein
MRSLGTRHLAMVAGLAAATAVAFAGCSAGQVAETSLKRPSNQGLNEENSNNTVAIRNLAVSYNGPEGYAAGDSAPLEVGLYNETSQPVTVLISSRQPDASRAKTVVSGTNVALVGGQPSSPSTAIPEPSGSRDAAVPETSNGPSGSVEAPSTSPSVATSPSASASPSVSVSASGESPSPSSSGTPARIQLSPLGYASFLPGDKQSLQVQGLSGKLLPGMAVNLVFEFSNGASPLTLQAPVGIPLSPAPRESPNPSENQEE